MRTISSVILSLAISGAVAQEAPQLAVVGVDVIDVDSGTVVPGCTILTEGGRIASVRRRAGDLPAGVTVIDGEGLFALPGLIDSHVHYMAPDVFDPLMVAYGVALVRDLGSATEPVLAIRDGMNAGTRRAPRMIATGAIVDGNPPVWPFSEACDTPEDGRAAVRKLAEAGVDQIKVYSRLEPEVYRAICEEARERGLAVVGHVPLAVPVAEAVAAGQLTVEHLTGFDGLFARRLIPGFSDASDFMARAQAWAMVGSLTDDDLAEIAAPFGEARLAQCPTLVVMEGIASFATAADDPMYRFAPASSKGFWESGNYAQWGRSMGPQIPGMKRFVGALHRAGAPILAGTDLANPNVIAGYSLHKELEYLVESGLTEAEALAAATVVPARLFGLEGLGSIEEGADATFLLLSANPLEEITATRSIEAVVHRGEHFDRAALDALLAEAEAAAGAAPAPAGGNEFDIADVELPGAVIASGVYAFKFGGFDAGTESFRVARDGEGYFIVAHSAPVGGSGREPYVLTVHADADRRFVSATYRPLAGGEATEYRREGDTLTASTGAETQTFAIPAGATVAGPALSTDFCVLTGLGLEVGESWEGTSVSFGMPNWKWTGVEGSVTRLPDEEFELVGRATPVRVYRQVAQIPGMGRFEVVSRVNADGVTVDSSMKMPFGSLETELAEWR